MSVTTPFLVSIYEQVSNYPAGSGFHYVRVEGFGCRSQGEAIERAKARSAHYQAANGRVHEAQHELVCPTCQASGRKPGCTRKACDACEGLGTIPDSTRGTLKLIR